MIFDLHAHPTLKPFLSRLNPAKKFSCWKQIEVCLFFDDSYISGDRLDSQSCLSQMQDGGVNLAMVALHALEREMAGTTLIRIINFLSSKLSGRLLHRIRKRKPGYGYIDLIRGELLNLRKAANERPGQLIFLKKSDSLEPMNLGGKINVIFSIEGGHTLLDTETVDEFDFNDDTQIALVLNRLDSLINDNPDLTFASLILVHLARGPFCNQAFAYPSFSEKCSTSGFLPRSLIGINKAGWSVIQKCLDKNMLIDVKHMSYVSRCQYYKYYLDNGIILPIMASHAGIANISFKHVKYQWAIESEFENCYKIKVPRLQGLMGTKSYPITLSLFDEEIKFIVDSKGLIGLSMDERILGYVKDITKTDKNFDIEYMYTGEFDYLESGSYDVDFSFLSVDADGSTYKTSDTAIYPLTDDLSDIQTQYFCNNVLRIVYAGGANAWDCICIGSDFDGLIDAIESCKTADKFENFRSLFLDWLLIMIQTVDNYWTIFFVDKDNLESDIEHKVDKILFENGRAFFTKYFGT